MAETPRSFVAEPSQQSKASDYSSSPENLQIRENLVARLNQLLEPLYTQYNQLVQTYKQRNRENWQERPDALSREEILGQARRLKKLVTNPFVLLIRLSSFNPGHEKVLGHLKALGQVNTNLDTIISRLAYPIQIRSEDVRSKGVEKVPIDGGNVAEVKLNKAQQQVDTGSRDEKNSASKSGTEKIEAGSAEVNKTYKMKSEDESRDDGGDNHDDSERADVSSNDETVDDDQKLESIADLEKADHYNRLLTKLETDKLKAGDFIHIKNADGGYWIFEVVRTGQKDEFGTWVDPKLKVVRCENHKITSINDLHLAGRYIGGGENTRIGFRYGGNKNQPQFYDVDSFMITKSPDNLPIFDRETHNIKEYKNGEKPLFSSEAYTDVGDRENNEDVVLKSEKSKVGDYFLVADGEGVDHHIAVNALADGMGGHAGGEEASSLAVEEFKSLTRRFMNHHIDTLLGKTETSLSAEERKGLVHELIKKEIISPIVEKLSFVARQNPGLSSMGTTFTAEIRIDDDKSLIIHIGASRAYIYDPSYRKIRQLTNDHTHAAQLSQKIKFGTDNPLYSRYKRGLARALAAGREVPDPDIHYARIKSGDLTLLVSDGIVDILTEEDLRNLVTEAGQSSHNLGQKAYNKAKRLFSRLTQQPPMHDSLTTIAQAIVEAAKAKDVDGEKDNLTVVAVS